MKTYGLSNNPDYKEDSSILKKAKELLDIDELSCNKEEIIE